MRSRAERNQDFEAIKSNLFDAGMSVVKAAKAHEEMFNTSLEAIADAMELNIGETPHLNQVIDGSQVNLIYEALSLQRQEAETKGDFDTYVSAEEKLQKLEEFEAERLERQARMLEAQVRIQTAQKQLAQEEPDSQTTICQPWTESTLKERYQTLKNVRDELGIAAKSWKDAVKAANQQKA
jgi:hypothetical protein